MHGCGLREAWDGHSADMHRAHVASLGYRAGGSGGCGAIAQGAKKQCEVSRTQKHAGAMAQWGREARGIYMTALGLVGKLCVGEVWEAGAGSCRLSGTVLTC